MVQPFPTKEDEDFTAWIEANGVELKGIKYAEIPQKAGGMRGLVAEHSLEVLRSAIVVLNLFFGQVVTNLPAYDICIAI